MFILRGFLVAGGSARAFEHALRVEGFDTPEDEESRP